MKTIKEVAQKTRRWAMQTNRRKHDFPSDLEGMCGIASVKLHANLEAEGYSPFIHYSEGHAFVVCDGMIVDVTATQFGRKPIEIVPMRRSKPWFWKTVGKFRTAKSFVNWQQVVGWPDEQIIGRLA